ncbi:hypothetical protein XELAEV_18029992mg [Xenopus laevis]|uniref:Uncharacterized protein n=1 Tax=Xenopus laevis TaxID=8355 RepID=A0A974HIB4_XENLA|nr:hypothetical protein XELAEV_18029992mg [Xenopus laevis]
MWTKKRLFTFKCLIIRAQLERYCSEHLLLIYFCPHYLPDRGSAFSIYLYGVIKDESQMFDVLQIFPLGALILKGSVALYLRFQMMILQ